MLASLALATSLLAGGIAAAAPGDLDPTFDSTGIAVTPVGNSGSSGANAVIRQSDGKLVAVGSAANGVNVDFALVRYNVDGTLDATFGTNGLVTTDVMGSEDDGQAVIEQADHKLVVAGISYDGAFSLSKVSLVRYDTNGAVDTTFGTNGIVTTQPSGSATYDGAQALLLQGTSLVVAGYADTDAALVRYTSSGALDTTFGGGTGIVTTGVGTSATAYALVEHASDHALLVAGSSDTSMFVARYDSTGTPDITFGGGGTGTKTLAIGSSAVARALVLDGSGNLVVAGSSMGTNLDFALARFTSSGAVDGTFGSAGVVTTPIGTGDDEARGLVIDGQGDFVAAGSTRNGTNPTDVALARYDSSGTLDPSFGTGGIVTTPIGTDNDHAFAITTQPDDKVVVAGNTVNGPAVDLVVLRYLDSAAPPTTTTTSGTTSTTTTLPPLPLSVTKLKVLLNFAKTNHDNVMLRGRFSPPAGFSSAGLAVTVDVGGVQGGATLNKKGKGKGFQVTRGGKVTVKLHGSFAATLADDGLANETVSAMPVDLPIALTVGGTAYAADAHASYTAKAGKKGTAK